VLAEIKAIHREHADYGSPRVTAEFARRGLACYHKKVEATMRRHGIVARRHRRRRNLTDPDASAAPRPDLVGRLFDPDRVDHTWVGDATCVPTDEGWLYLASVLDLGSRRLLGLRHEPGGGHPRRIAAGRMTQDPCSSNARTS
jgi:transposase InsO family protein